MKFFALCVAATLPWLTEAAQADRLRATYISCNAEDQNGNPHCGNTIQPVSLSVTRRVIKWGRPNLGTGAIVRYTFITEPYSLRNGLPQAQVHCPRMLPLHRLLQNRHVTLDEVRAITRQALDRWSAVADIIFVEVTDMRVADVLIGEQEDGWDGAWTNLRLSFSDEGNTYTIQKSAICLNLDPIIVSGVSRDFPIDRIIGHEFGHAVGLDHSASDGALMARRPSSTTLTSSDIQGIQTLYGPRQK